MHESADGKERGRRKKFDAWFRKVAHANLVKHDGEIPLGRVMILVSILVAKKHPFHDAIIKAFEQVVMEATTKPEEQCQESRFLSGERLLLNLGFLLC